MRGSGSGDHGGPGLFPADELSRPRLSRPGSWPRAVWIGAALCLWLGAPCALGWMATGAIGALAGAAIGGAMVAIFSASVR